MLKLLFKTLKRNVKLLQVINIKNKNIGTKILGQKNPEGETSFAYVQYADV
jgi:hypothetical protein